MPQDQNLTTIVNGDGVFLRFRTSDGETLHTDAITLAEQTDPVMRRIVLRWCMDRINETPNDELPAGAREGLIAVIGEMMEERSGLETAAAIGGSSEPIDSAWLVEHERRTAGAPTVSLPGDQFRALLGLAKRGLLSDVT
jgi:hypothetical protein